MKVFLDKKNQKYSIDGKLLPYRTTGVVQKIYPFNKNKIAQKIINNIQYDKN